MDDLMARISRRVNNDEMKSLLCDLVALETVNPPGNEMRVASYLADWFAERGVECDMTEVEPQRANVVARVKFSRPGPTFIFNSHLDVVPSGSGWTTDPFRPVVKDGFIYGRGAADAKGPVAGMVAALALLKDMDAELRGEIIFQGVMDEEVSSHGTRALVPTMKGDMAIVGEPTGGKICIAHKGTARALIVVMGKTAHAAEPETGVNAISGAAALIPELERYHWELKKHVHPVCGSPTAAVTIIAGGVKGNMVPDRCELQLSRRMTPGENEAKVARELDEIFQAFHAKHPLFRPTVEKFFQTSGGPSETPADHPFVTLAQDAVIEMTGEDKGLGGLSVNCDMSLLRGVVGIPTIILGPGETSIAHQPNEHVSIDQLGEVTRLYACIAARALAA